MTQKHSWPIGALLIATLVFAGCGDSQGAPGEAGPAGEAGQNGAPGTTSLVDVEAIEPGPDCAAGGVRITTGVDADASGDLSADEAAAGNSTVQCNVEPQPACSEVVSIDGVNGADASFVVGQPSSPLTVELSTTTNVRLVFLGPDFDYTAGANVGEFTVTPLTEGGPFFITVVATNGCSFDQATVTIATVAGA